MPVPLLDLSRQSPSLQKSLEEAVLRVLNHQQFILGSEVTALEDEIAAFFGNGANAIAVSSGTDAQLALLMALEIGSGDAVITTPYTFFSTAGCIHRVGAEILFCDIDPQSYLMDPEKLRLLLSSLKRDTEGHLRTARGNRVRTIIPIHLFGTCCDMEAIGALAKEYGLSIIEDAAQAIGTDYPSPQGPIKAGTIADMSFFSFYPTKNLAADGDAGLVVCRDPAMAEKVRLVRNHGMEQRYYHKIVGGNFRMDGFQAAVLRVKLPFLQEWNEQRRTNAALYKKAFTKAGLLDHLTLPHEPWAASGLADHHIYHQYVIRFKGNASETPSETRTRVIAHLTENSIGHGIYYPVPLHLQECFAYLGYKQGDLPEAESATLETLALPIYPYLREEELNAVVASLAEAFSREG